MKKTISWILVAVLGLVMGYSGYRIISSLCLGSTQNETHPSMQQAQSTVSTAPSTRWPTHSTAPSESQTTPTLPDPVNPLAGKVAIFLGDSICAGTTVGEDNPYYGYGWGGLIGEKNGMHWANYGKNGAVILGAQPMQRTIWEQLQTAKKQHASVDYILLEGGCNDAYQLGWDADQLGEISPDFENFDTETFTGALEALFRDTKQAYPEAKIGYILTHKMGRAPFDAHSNVIRQYYERIIAVCEKWEIPYLDLWQESELDPSNLTHFDPTLTAGQAIAAGKFYIDSQHLTLAGYEKIVPLIEAFMRTL